MADPIKAYGWTAMPRKVETLLATRTTVQPPAPVSIKEITLPDSPLAKAVHEYAKKELAPETFNHSVRVYYYGMHLIPKPSSTPTNPVPIISPSPNKTPPHSLTNPRHRNRPILLPNLAHPLLHRDLLAHLPAPRHRHHGH
jgi:hypothetical protein